MAELKRRYEVERLKGTVQREVLTISEKDGSFIPKMVEEPAGFMVYFPNGSSVRIRTEEELGKQGFDVPAPLVDMDSGEIIDTSEGSLKAHSEQKQVKPRRGFTPPVPTT